MSISALCGARSVRIHLLNKRKIVQIAWRTWIRLQGEWARLILKGAQQRIIGFILIWDLKTELVQRRQQWLEIKANFNFFVLIETLMDHRMSRFVLRFPCYFRSSAIIHIYTKISSWAGFEPTTSQFQVNALDHSAMKAWTLKARYIERQGLEWNSHNWNEQLPASLHCTMEVVHEQL